MYYKDFCFFCLTIPKNALYTEIRVRGNLIKKFVSRRVQK
jgi:hypothetical protein